MRTLIFLLTSIGLTLSSCGRDAGAQAPGTLPQEKVAVFTSTDTLLQKSFEWARKMALSYSHDDSDPVGFWYEAALPKREAFCMRDVSHQSVAAQILGLSDHNKNMFSRFAANISENRDWCTFWEINRYDKPVPADYVNDKEFWYNLTANFDVMQACLKMYEWTGDADYLNDTVFTDFYDHTVNDYVYRWRLSESDLMKRPRFMNISENFDINNHFYKCRGLPSYVENVPGVKVGVDLVAALYAGHSAYSQISHFRGNPAVSAQSMQKAESYRQLLDREWWDNDNNRYNTALLEDGSFHRGEGVAYVLWFEACHDSERIRNSLADIASGQWNVENMSFMPSLFYRYGYCDEAYRYLVSLPSMSRSEYPEVSFGFIEGCVAGAMGFQPSFIDKTVQTMSRLTGKDIDSKIKNIKVFDGYMSLQHSGNSITELTNDTSSEITWKPSFIGDFVAVEVNGKRLPVTHSSDVRGNMISTAEVVLPPKSTLKARALEE